MRTFDLTILEEKITPHLRRLIRQGSIPIGLQFKRQDFLVEEKFVNVDPLGEETRYSPVKGIIHKFSNRILWKVSYRCAAHCQFCTRSRQIGGSDGDLSARDIETALQYISSHKEVDDVILSGGDPFVTPKVTKDIIGRLVQIESVKVIRIGTRLPVHSPSSFKSEPVKHLLSKICSVTKSQPVFVLLHLNHPDELTVETVEAIRLIQGTGAILMTQTVFLNDINDSVEVLAKLFIAVYHLGIIPHYLFHCDKVGGLERFIVPLEKEREIVTELCKRLSGIAIPRYAIDVPGKGKIDIPLGFWEGVDLTNCSDYEGTTINLVNL